MGIMYVLAVVAILGLVYSFIFACIFGVERSFWRMWVCVGFFVVFMAVMIGASVLSY